MAEVALLKLQYLEHIGVGAQSTLGGRSHGVDIFAQKLCMKN